MIWRNQRRLCSQCAGSQVFTLFVELHASHVTRFRSLKISVPKTIWHYETLHGSDDQCCTIIDRHTAFLSQSLFGKTYKHRKHSFVCSNPLLQLRWP